MIGPGKAALLDRIARDRARSRRPGGEMADELQARLDAGRGDERGLRAAAGRQRAGRAGRRLAEEVVVFAAASMKTRWMQVAADFQAETGNT
jgi:broad specificity phosphatase PhoE